MIARLKAIVLGIVFLSTNSSCVLADIVTLDSRIRVDKAVLDAVTFGELPLALSFTETNGFGDTVVHSASLGYSRSENGASVTYVFSTHMSRGAVLGSHTSIQTSGFQLGFYPSVHYAYRFEYAPLQPFVFEDPLDTVPDLGTQISITSGGNDITNGGQYYQSFLNGDGSITPFWEGTVAPGNWGVIVDHRLSTLENARNSSGHFPAASTSGTFILTLTPLTAVPEPSSTFMTVIAIAAIRIRRRITM